MTEKSKKQRRITVAVNLTASEREALEKFVCVCGLEMAAVARCLLLALINGKVTLPELLQKYRNKAKEPASSEKIQEFKTSELRIHRVCIRLTTEEKQELTALAHENFHSPAELARILLKLFIMGVIRPGDIMY